MRRLFAYFEFSSLNSNIAPATFWFFVETVLSKDLFDDAVKEVSSATRASENPPRFDQKRLLNSPLLQSIYAETLRMYVSVLMLRKTRQESQLGGWVIPKSQHIAVCNYSEHMNEKLWNPEGSADMHPVGEFWGRRFLTFSDAKGMVEEPAPTESSELNQRAHAPRFSSEGLSCKWFPFGFGERVCPGRAFAKHQMLVAFALLSSTFDIELQLNPELKPKPNMKHFGYGVMPPETKTPFRIRRRVCSL